MDGGMYVCIDGCVYGMEGWMDEWMVRGKDERIYQYIYLFCLLLVCGGGVLKIFIYIKTKKQIKKKKLTKE